MVDPIDFVTALDLEDVPTELAALDAAPVEPSDNDAAAYVDDGSLVSFVSGVGAQHKSDVLNSTLLAQLAANKKYKREKQTREWYDYYRTVLENVGWVVSNFDFKAFQAGGDKFSVDEVVLKVLAAIATGNDLAIVTQTWEALKALGDEDRRIVLFNQASHGDEAGSFQISAVAESDDVAVMKIGAFHFSTTESVTNLLWFTFATARTQFYQGSQTMDLNDEVYSRVREAVLEKLGDRATDFVAEIEI